MTFNFTVKEFIIGNGTGTPTLQFYKKGFDLGGSASPEWQDIILSGNTALTLVNAKADSLEYLKLFGNAEQLPETYLDTVTLSGGCEQRNLPSGYTQVEYVTNTAQTLLDTGVKFDFSKNYEIELRVRGTLGSWYILQAKETSGNEIWGLSGSQNGQTIRLGFGTSSVNSQISRVVGNIYYIKATINNGNLTLYVKDETAGTEDTATGTYTVTTGQSPNICLFGNLVPQYVAINSDVYFARIKEDGNYIMDYVPCKQSTTAGFYDKATNTLKTARYLSAGADVVVPSPTNPMDIVCNNGVVKVSKNLFDKVAIESNWVTNRIKNDSGTEIQDNTSTYSSYFIPVKPSTTYYISGSSEILTRNPIQRIYYYTSSKTWISRTTPETVYKTPFTTPSNCYFIQVQKYNATYETATNIQLEQGSTATTYMPYGQIYIDGTVETVTDSNQLTATAERLLAVGDYKDTQEVLSGSVTRNVGIKVFDGTEEWTHSTGGSERTHYCYCSLSGINTNTTTDIICSHYGVSNANTPVNNKVCVRLNRNGFLFGDNENCTTVETWNNYLAQQYANGTPVIIVYPTSSATTESVSGQLLQKSPVTQTAGSISNLPIAITESSHSVPTPTQPLPINCNNGVVKVSPNLFNETWEQGAISGTPDKTYEETKTALTTRIRVVNEIYLDHTKTYTISINNPDLEFVIQVFNSQHRLYTITDVSNVWGTSPKTFTGAYGVVVALRYKTQVDILPTEGQNAKVQLELGSVATPYKPYGIYTDGTTETVEITGKNLFTGQEDITQGYYLNDNGVATPADSLAYTNGYTEVNGGTYTFSGYGYAVSEQRGNFSAVCYDENKNVLGRVGRMEFRYNYSTFTTLPNTKYLRFNLPVNTASTSPLQLELGSTATTYEPYFNGGQATAENLFKVGDYQDVQSVIDGGVTRNVGVKVLDGTENWTYDIQYSRFSLDENIGVVNTTIARSIPAFCTHYGIDSSQTPIGNLPDNTGYIGSIGSGQYSRFWVHTSAYNDATNYKAFLASEYQAGHPVVLVYPLQTPTTETVESQELTIQAGSNTVSIVQASMDDLELEVKYKATI